jgi:DNA-binding NtrC family response regulator
VKITSPQRPRVLIVDDEPGLRALLEWELSDHGIEVKTARDGEEATQLVEQMPFDIVLTDLTMPKADGLVLLEHLKKTKPETPVIIATGFGTVETAVQAMQKGAYDFLLKPLDVPKLIALIQKVLRRPPSSCLCRGL